MVIIRKTELHQLHLMRERRGKTSTGIHAVKPEYVGRDRSQAYVTVLLLDLCLETGSLLGPLYLLGPLALSLPPGSGCCLCSHSQLPWRP